MTTAVIGGQLLNSFAGAGVGLAQGIMGKRRSEDFANEILAASLLEQQEVRRAFVKRQGDVQQAFAGGGVDVTRGTPLDFRRDNQFRAEEAVARIQFSAAMRAFRAEEEGRATLSAGVAASTRSLTAGFRTLLDLPFGSGSDAPSLAFQADISETAVNLLPGAGPSSDPFALDF